MTINNTNFLTTKNNQIHQCHLELLPTNSVNSSVTELKLNDYQRVLCSDSIEVIG